MTTQHMSRSVREVRYLGQLRIILIDSVTQVKAEDEGHVVVTGSHGGVSSGGYAADVRAALYAFNDAGIGKDYAGVAALLLLDERGIAALCVSHRSARIGEAHDTLEHGVVSMVNRAARSQGFTPDVPLLATLKMLS